MTNKKEPPKNTKTSEPTGAPQPFRVGGPLNYFGTRRRRRIECDACGKVDYVSVFPKEGQKIYCQACAQNELALYEEGAVLPQVLRTLQCPECSRNFEVPEYFPEDDELLCPDCHKGFETWSGTKEGVRDQKAYEKRPSGAVLRRKKVVPPQS